MELVQFMAITAIAPLLVGRLFRDTVGPLLFFIFTQVIQEI